MIDCDRSCKAAKTLGIFEDMSHQFLVFNN